MTVLLDRPLLRAARRAALILGVGTLGAAVCSAGTTMLVSGRDGSASPASSTSPLSSTRRSNALPRPLDQAEARALSLLRRAFAAARITTYSGTKLLTSQASGQATTVLDVRHSAGRGTWIRVRSGEAGASAGHLEAETAAEQLDRAALGSLTRSYSLVTNGLAHCAGRTTEVVEARQLGETRVSGRFWLDRETGLLLRRELYSASGGLVRATVFLDVAVGPDAAAPPNSEPANSASANSASANSGPANSEPANPEPANSGPANPEPANSEPANPEPANSGPANSEPANPEPANSGPANPEPANSGPANPEPANSGPANSEPANPEPANSGPPNSKPASLRSSGPDSAGSAPTRLTDQPVLPLSPAVTLSESDLDNLRGQGWVLPDTLPGGMDRYAAKVLDDEGRQVVQVSYSDGLFSASLFVQRGGLDADRLKGFHRERVGDSVMYVRAGLLRTLVWTGVAGDDASSSAVYTLVLDAPEEDGPPIVAALPHAPLGDDLAARLDRGLDRVRSWANPFA